MAFIKLSNICDDPEDELFHDTAEQRAAHTAWDLATKELSGLPAIFGTHWTHKWLHQEIVGFLRTLSTEEAKAWDYEVRNALAREEAGVDDYDAFADVENWEDFVYDDFEAQEAAKICIAAAAYAVNSQPASSPRESAAITPRRQTGGSNSDDSASDDHDLRLICWTSALEVIAAAIPAAKTIQKQTRHIRHIGNCRLELAYYPPDFAPDYTFQTLIRAALEVGYTAGPGALSQSLQSTVGVASHPLWPLYNCFEIYVEIYECPTTLARQDPYGVWHKIAARVARHACHAWTEDPIHGNDIVHDVEVSTYISLLQHYDHKRGGAVATYARYWARSHLRDALARLKTYMPRTEVKRRLTLAEQLLARHPKDAPADAAGRAAWEHRRRGLAADVEKYRSATGGLIVVAPSSLDAPISEAEDSLSVVDTMVGDAGDNVDALQHEAASNAVRACLSNQGINDLIEKIHTVSTKIREDGESDMEYLARVAVTNKPLVALIKKSIGPDGLSALAEYL